jgi:hypothetical protein
VAYFSRLVTVVIDVPAGDHDRELSFWEAALGQPLHKFDYPEYHGVALHGQDFWLLIQRLGGGELVLPPAEAEERINAFYRHRQETALAARPGRRRPPNIPGVDVPAFELSPELADAETVGVIYDEIYGLNFFNEYGMLRDLFADPALASDKRYADVLRGYLRAETIGPLPFRRLAAAHPQTVDVVFRKILRQPHFTWAEHGEALLRRRKPWYYEREPRPDRTVISVRLGELISR